MLLQGGENMLSFFPLIPSLYVVVEVAFYFVFHWYFVPRANRRTTPQPFRDHGNDRHSFLDRLLCRIDRLSRHQGLTARESGEKFLREWFEPITNSSSPKRRVSRKTFILSRESSLFPSLLHTDSSSSSTAGSSVDSNSVSSLDEQDAVSTTNSSSSLSSSTVSATTKTIASPVMEDIGKEEMDDFIAWALFEKTMEEMLPWELDELQLCYDLMKKRLQLDFAPGRFHKHRPRRLSMDDVDSLHRPLLIYFVIFVFRFLLGIYLRLVGYQRIVSSQTGLVSWYRPARDEASAQLAPIVFFHGIAPAGLFFYVPMVMHGLLRDGRASLLVENNNVTCNIGFHALTEAETVLGLTEIVGRVLSPHQGLSLCGHSFGSVPITWCLHAEKLRPRIRNVILLDPVTVLLSESDVMVNFLYCRTPNIIRMIVGSELFTTYYLRKHFAWYNSELWLEDIPDSVQTLIALSGKDEIVNAQKVNDYLDWFRINHPSSRSKIRVLFWENAGHAACVSSRAKWEEIRTALRQNEGAAYRRKQD